MCCFQTASEEECTKGPGKEVTGKDLLVFINCVILLSTQILDKESIKEGVPSFGPVFCCFFHASDTGDLNSYFQLNWVWIHFATCCWWVHINTESKLFMYKFLRLTGLLGRIFQWTHWSSDFLLQSLWSKISVHKVPNSCLRSLLSVYGSPPEKLSSVWATLPPMCSCIHPEPTPAMDLCSRLQKAMLNHSPPWIPRHQVASPQVLCSWVVTFSPAQLQAVHLTLFLEYLLVPG